MTKSRHQASPVALELIKPFEGLRRVAAQLADGRWTVGYGHTRFARQGVELSEDDATALLIYDLRGVAAAIDEAVFAPLTQNQFDALASFAFNVGVENFRHSAVLRHINEGAMLEAAFALEMWRKADFEGERIVVDALVRRRAAEKALFLTPRDGWAPVPSSVIVPKADHGSRIAELDAPVAELTAGLEGPVARPIRIGWVGEDEVEISPSRRAAEAASPPQESGEPASFLVAAAADDEPAPFASHEALEGPSLEAIRRNLYGDPQPRAAVRPRLAALWPLALLGLAGLALFVTAVVWAFHARPIGGAVTPLNVGVVVVGVIGILVVASVVYFLLEQLAGRDL